MKEYYNFLNMKSMKNITKENKTCMSKTFLLNKFKEIQVKWQTGKKEHT